MAVQAATSKPQDGVTPLQNDKDKYFDSSLTFDMNNGKTDTYTFYNSISIQDNANGITQFHIDGREITPKDYSAYKANAKLNPHRTLTTYEVKISLLKIEAKINDHSVEGEYWNRSVFGTFMTSNLCKIIEVIASNLPAYLDKAIEKELCVDTMIERARNPHNSPQSGARILSSLLQAAARQGNAHKRAIIFELLVEQANLSDSKVRGIITGFLKEFGLENAIEKTVHEPSYVAPQ